MCENIFFILSSWQVNVSLVNHNHSFHVIYDPTCSVRNLFTYLQCLYCLFMILILSFTHCVAFYAFSYLSLYLNQQKISIDYSGIRTHNLLLLKGKLKHLTKKAKWLTCCEKLSIWFIDCLCLSYHIDVYYESPFFDCFMSRNFLL